MSKRVIRITEEQLRRVAKLSLRENMEEKVEPGEMEHVEGEVRDMMPEDAPSDMEKMLADAFDSIKTCVDSIQEQFKGYDTLELYLDPEEQDAMRYTITLTIGCTVDGEMPDENAVQEIWGTYFNGMNGEASMEGDKIVVKLYVGSAGE